MWKKGKKELKDSYLPHCSDGPHNQVDCTLGCPIGLDPACAKCFNYTTVNQHFKCLQNVFDGKGIPLSNLHNFDEIRCQIRGGHKDTRELYLFATHDQSQYKIKSDNLEHVDLSKPIVLMYDSDGHGSHVMLEMIDKALQHNIILFHLPPHTTHHLQPCDVGAFRPLRHAWNKWCNHIFQTTGVPLTAKDFIREYMLAWKESFKVDTIKKAWEKSGIDVGDDGPKCTPKMFTEADFVSSHSSSTLLHLPASFPVLPIPIDKDSSDNGSDDEADNTEHEFSRSNHALFGPASQTQSQACSAVASVASTSTSSGVNVATSSSTNKASDVTSGLNAASDLNTASGPNAASGLSGIDDSAELPPFQSLTRFIMTRTQKWVMMIT